MIVENEYPILEYSTQQDAVINPGKGEETFPRLCIMTFFQEVMDSFLEKYSGRVIGTYISEMRPFPVYKLTYNGIEICLIQAVVASGSIAMMTDWLYGSGVEVLLCCGGCGVLADIPAGDVIIPVRALRDEGASYKYLPPAKYIDLPQEPVRIFREVLAEYQIPYIECTTWTTDGFFRETRDMVEHRVKQGCQAVEMECATMAAIARFRNKVFGQLLYSGDILSGEEYDDRHWNDNTSAREKLFQVTLESLVRL
ncbi:MAG: nucleoside phosphorylase [bacterium]|nr:nucleoside phosphorylase [bacterium]MCM1376248.1 nucleoside phosphorylase [Muribaculum sp.]